MSNGRRDEATRTTASSQLQGPGPRSSGLENAIVAKPGKSATDGYAASTNIVIGSSSSSYTRIDPTMRFVFVSALSTKHGQ
ncbi:hypothetical protein PG996_002560 [Apiospora saccharicola]|uniref:Uncharacterized protein n=1 Tax=Apiospora saccharicola TaxID=335842 RepID=A0ABR1WNV6_9PEZI